MKKDLNTNNIYSERDRIVMENLIDIKFGGYQGNENAIPAEILMQVLEGLQRSIYLLGMQNDGIEVRQRERVSAIIEEKYPVVCYLPKRGSYEIPASIGNPASDFFAEQDISAVINMFTEAISAIVNNGASQISKIIPDTYRLNRFIDACKKIIPQKGSGVTVNILKDKKNIFESLKVEKSIYKIQSRIIYEESFAVVTGKLVQINFEERKITITYPPTDKDLECFYKDNVEEMLLRKPRSLIQVTGKVKLDENEMPKSIVEVVNIQELDLTTFYYAEIESNKYRYKFVTPLLLQPTLDESQQLICIDYPDLGINIYAETREDLDIEFREKIDFLWENYAECEDSELTKDAILLKNNLISKIKRERL